MGDALTDPTSESANRECIECHDSGAARRDRDTGVVSVTQFTTCKDCHTDEKRFASKPVLAVREVKKSFKAFNHEAHDSQQCADCHTFDLDSDSFAPAKQDMLGSLCVICHAKHDTESRMYRGAGNDACSKCHFDKDVITRLKPAQRGVFDHKAHLPRSPRTDDCIVCHTGVGESKSLTDGGIGGVRTEACAKCHQSAPGKPAAEVKPAGEPSMRFYTEFPHEAHVRSTPECSACHELKGNGSFAWSRPGLPDYEGCVNCHYHKKWEVAKHGTAGAPQCGKCHESSGPAIRMIEVEKVDLGLVAFSTVDHPFIDQAELGAAEDCGRCHVRPRDDMHSRIDRKPFAHRQHLGKTGAEEAARGSMPSRDVCLACHSQLKVSDAPSTTKSFDLTRDCAKCHRGSAGATQLATRTVKVPRFGHASHLASESPRIKDCGSCHGYDLAEDRMTTPKDVMNCKLCHDHKHNADVTGKDLDKCLNCHTGGSLFRMGDLELADPEKIPVAFERLGDVAFAPQHHNLATRQCEQCHAPAGGFAVKIKSVKKVDHVNDGHKGRSLDSCGECHVKMRN